MSAAVQIIGRKVLGSYTVVRLIGEGGMGAVYVAENVELGRRLALKILLPQWSANEAARARFLAEARAASAIKHPNVIEVIDTAVFEDGTAYIVMEYLDGATLADHLRRFGALPLHDALVVLLQVCSALEAAHERGVIHRDLKPANIMLERRPGRPLFAKILDFGIAKLADTSLARDVRTHTGAVAGTPSYMSPEQARALRDVDHRTDIYALGVVAYETITGRLPYDASSIGDLIFRQMQQPLVAPDVLREDVPPAWSDAIVDAMANDPAARPATAAVFARLLIAATPGGEELAMAVAPELVSGTVWHARQGSVQGVAPGISSPISTLSMGVGQKQRSITRRPSRRRRPLLVGGALAVMGVVAGVAFGVGRGREPATHEPATVAVSVPSSAPPPAIPADAAPAAIPTPPDAGAPDAGRADAGRADAAVGRKKTRPRGDPDIVIDPDRVE